MLFGAEDILVNNIAWALRRLPVFGVFGTGNYGVRPIHVEDLAALAIAGGERSLGRSYAGELRRRRQRDVAYASSPSR